ncbi:hypothetical protein K449DRAFT_383854 [Hypoxylon sp. EC38]|nr:hypothetical protein K449DRAFT_383854 [Hypoxylon sp. EC38]
MTTRSAAASAAAAASSTTTTTSTTSRTRAQTSTTGRPSSGVYSKAPSTRPDYGNGAAKPLGRAASTRQASSSTNTAPPVTRSASIASRPRSSGGPPPTTASNRLSGHSRSKSTVTSLTAATTLRPVRPISQVSSSSSGGRTSPTASTITTTSSKPQTRSTTTHARKKSQPQPQPQPSQPQTRSTSGTIRPPSQQPTAALTNRPAFNTHQQHYSPAKSLAPKPLTSTFLAPPSPSKLPANVAISAETSRLQTELLQLSLLHRDAPAVDAEWHASARAKLEARFKRLARDNEALVSLERQGVEARNVAALARWGDADGLGLEEKVQILDEVLNGVWQLGEPGGRYQRVVAGFEAWAENMAAIVSAQRSGNVDGLVEGDEVRFLGELDTGWKHDCMGLLRKVEAWSAALRELGDVSSVTSSTDSSSGSGSGLERMVSGCRTLVHDMLAELDLMSQIERDAARAEDEWIESMNKAIEDEDDDTPAARAYVPLWKLAT